MRHNIPGGWIAIRTLQEPSGAVFEIANTGPAVSAEQVLTLFEPFARAEQRLNHSDGVGLGLSIAKRDRSRPRRDDQRPIPHRRRT